MALAGTFYNWVMYELQCHVDIMELPPIYFVITLGDVASTYGTALPPSLPGSDQGLWREGINTIVSNGAMKSELDFGPEESGSWLLGASTNFCNSWKGLQDRKEWRSGGQDAPLPPPALHLGMGGTADRGLPYIGAVTVGFL